MTTIATADARRLEEAFLGGLNDAQDAYERIVAAEAWIALGHETFVDWWESRVRPAMTALSMRPTREIAAAVVDRVRADEADLPATQRRTQRELADLVGVDRSALANRDGSRSLPREESRRADLEEPQDPIPAPITDEIERRIAEKTGDLRHDPAPSATDGAPADIPATEDEPEPNRVANWLNGDPALTVTAWRKRYMDAIHASGGIVTFSPEQVAEKADPALVDELHRLVRDLTDYARRVDLAWRQQNSGLRLVSGGGA